MEAALEAKGREDGDEGELVPTWNLCHAAVALEGARTGGKGAERRADTRRETQEPTKGMTEIQGPTKGVTEILEPTKGRKEKKVGMGEEVKGGMREETKGMELGRETGREQDPVQGRRGGSQGEETGPQGGTAREVEFKSGSPFLLPCLSVHCNALLYAM